MGMSRRFCTCTYEFRSTVTEGVVHSVHKIVIQSSFGVIQRHKVSQGIGYFAKCLSNGYQRWVQVNGGCFLVTNICSSVILKDSTTNRVFKNFFTYTKTGTLIQDKGTKHK